MPLAAQYICICICGLYNGVGTPQVAARLRNISAAAQGALREALRRYKRGFVWWRPEGLAYEFTLAALGERVASLGLEPAHGKG